MVKHCVRTLGKYYFSTAFSITWLCSATYWPPFNSLPISGCYFLIKILPGNRRWVRGQGEVRGRWITFSKAIAMCESGNYRHRKLLKVTNLQGMLSHHKLSFWESRPLSKVQRGLLYVPSFHLLMWPLAGSAFFYLIYPSSTSYGPFSLITVWYVNFSHIGNQGH